MRYPSKHSGRRNDMLTLVLDMPKIIFNICKKYIMPHDLTVGFYRSPAILVSAFSVLERAAEEHQFFTSTNNDRRYPRELSFTGSFCHFDNCKALNLLPLFFYRILIHLNVLMLISIVDGVFMKCQIEA